MKFLKLAVLTLSFALTASGGTKLLTVDPLTGLPLYPATDSPLHSGNNPTRLPESSVCNSKMRADFYVVYDATVVTTLKWYAAHLSGFKVTHAYINGRSQDTLYNSDGTLAVEITGSAAKSDGNTDAYSIVYARFQPGLAEKTIISLKERNVVCR